MNIRPVSRNWPPFTTREAGSWTRTPHTCTESDRYLRRVCLSMNWSLCREPNCLSGFQLAVSLQCITIMQNINVYSYKLNTLRPTHAIWRQKSCSILIHVMAPCRPAPSHYLNQFWRRINKIPWHSFQGNNYLDTQDIQACVCALGIRAGVANDDNVWFIRYHYNTVVFLPNNHHRHLIARPRVCCLVSLNSDLCSLSPTTVLNWMTCNIGPHYSGTWLHF